MFSFLQHGRETWGGLDGSVRVLFSTELSASREGEEKPMGLLSLLLPSLLFKGECLEEFYYAVYWIITFGVLLFCCLRCICPWVGVCVRAYVRAEAKTPQIL